MIKTFCPYIYINSDFISFSLIFCANSHVCFDSIVKCVIHCYSPFCIIPT